MHDVPRLPQEVIHTTYTTPEQDEKQTQNPHVGEPTKKSTALKTYKTSLGNTISQLFTNKHLLKFDNLRQWLKSAKRCKNYTAIYKKYYQTETLIWRQIEQELQQARLDIQTWKQEFKSEHN